MNLDWYITFITMSETLNYRKASEELFISESNIYQQIKKIEEHFDVKLFKNQGHKLYMTNSGKELYEYAKNILETQSSIEDSMRASKMENDSLYSYEIKVGVTEYVANYLLSDFLKARYQDDPQCKLSVSIIKDGSISELNDNMLDLTIGRKKTSSNIVTYKQVCEGKIGLFVPLEYKYKDLKTALDDYPVLIDEHLTYGKNVKKMVSKYNRSVKFMHLETVQLITQLIENGQGIAFLPVYVYKNIKNMQLIYSDDFKEITSFTYMGYQNIDNKIERFMNLFQQYIKKEQSLGESFIKSIQ